VNNHRKATSSVDSHSRDAIGQRAGVRWSRDHSLFKLAAKTRLRFTSSTCY